MLAQWLEAEQFTNGGPILLSPLHAQIVDFLKIGNALKVSQGQLRDRVGKDALAQGLLPELIEGWVGGDHLVEDAAERPDVRLVVVGLVLEHLRRAVRQRSRELVRIVVA